MSRKTLGNYKALSYLAFAFGLAVALGLHFAGCLPDPTALPERPIDVPVPVSRHIV